MDHAELAAGLREAMGGPLATSTEIERTRDAATFSDASIADVDYDKLSKLAFELGRNALGWKYYDMALKALAHDNA